MFKGDIRYHIIALFTIVVWGTTFVSTKVLLNHGLSPVTIFFMRFALAYIAIWSIAPRRLWADSRRDEWLMCGAGVAGGSLYFLLENVALEFSPASNVSLLVCTTPLWTMLLFATVYRGERLTLWKIAASVVSIAGVVLVVLNGRFVLKLSPKGDVLALAAAMMWALYSLVMRRLGDKYDMLFVSRKIFFYGLLTIAPAMFWSPLVLDLGVLSQGAVWGNILYLGVVASMICYVLWNRTINHLGAVRTTNYIYLNPVVTIITSFFILHERITMVAVAGTILILAGMYFVEHQPKWRRKA